MRKLLILGAILTLLATARFGLWYYNASARQEEPFRTETVQRGDLLASFSATGTLEPEDIIDVGAQVAGQIKDFGVDTRTGKPIDYGSEVEAGAVLAKIDDALYSAKVNQSQAPLTVARAAHDQAVATVDAANARGKGAQATPQTPRANDAHDRRD